ncbi:MAG TPA: heavy-metal-associated domain-containing protein [Candidatus Spyradenecus faecavium]|uniref:Heavy-metal-associated domain-containing protein n=1 Tax=Candidatus Spyradenecus faecavium TaxID=2840947 RepID=A0A9D1NND2_9BACT|nr:heavy-metal-associated domain-containing protein [Candidatus Spyradenecus faecavium]
MKQSFRLQGLDCANCAAKLERALAKLDGMEHASVNFLTQRMSLQAPDARWDEVVAAAKALVKKLEPDVVVA